MNIRFLAASALLSFGSCHALAAPSVSDKGYNVLSCEAWTMTVGDGHTVTYLRSKVTQVPASGPMDRAATGECGGTIESLPKGQFKAGGYCVFLDRDGDKWVDRWWNESGMKTGRWEDTGLTGKWKGFRDAGSFVYTDLSSSEACRGISAWERDR